MNDADFLFVLLFTSILVSGITAILCYRAWGAKADAWDDYVEHITTSTPEGFRYTPGLGTPRDPVGRDPV